jgi:response regulator RpfG family c-di-GMP phosphodiesterase
VVQEDPSLLVFTERPRILVVDDEAVITEILSDFLSMEGWDIETATSGPAALRMFEAGSVDLMISDLKMPEMSGLELMDEVHKRNENIVVIIMTAFGTVETAIEAMKKGAFDYILKPFKMEEVVQIVRRAIDMKRLADENIRLKSTLSLYRLFEKLDVTLSLNEMLDRILDYAMGQVDADELSIYLQRPDSGELELRRKLQASGHDKETSIDLERVSMETGSGRFLISHGQEIREFVRATDTLPDAFLSMPLIHQSKRVGVLNVMGYEGKRFTEGQRKLLSILSGRAALSIENYRLMQELRDTVRKTIQSLASALEAMDRYTAGHSDRVTVYSLLIGRVLGMPAHETEVLQQAALMHDIGKIGCHANLNKKEALTAKEYEIFKEHPTHGKNIIEPLTFLHPVIPGVHLHHERWDGKGYPVGLSGEEIPLMARILAVADSYDAMTSNRAYRKALTHRVAIEELKRCAGTQFDPAIVEAFLDAIDSYRKEAARREEPVPP